MWGIDKRDRKIRKSQVKTRCRCNAHLIIAYNRDSGKYIMIDFIIGHNNNLHLSTTKHMMPSQ
jgi:hypothetical protein